MHFDVVLSIYSSMLKKSEESSVDAAVCLRALRVCASGMCVCVRALRVCVRASGVCVCARASGVCVCVCARASDVCVCVRARALQMCVCVCARFRCVCALFICVCVCVCVLQYAENFSHSARLLLNNPERFICSPRAFVQSLYRVLTREIDRECTRWR